MIQRTEHLSPREIQLQQFEEKMFEKQAEQVLAVKRLELEQAKLEAKWSSWLKIPVTIILLPVKVVLAFALITSLITKKDLPPVFWDYLK